MKNTSLVLFDGPVDTEYMKTTNTNSEFNTLSPGQKILLSAAVFAVLGSFLSFMVFGGTLKSMESLIQGFTVFVIGGMFAALIPVVLGRTYYAVTHHSKGKK